MMNEQIMNDLRLFKSYINCPNCPITRSHREAFNRLLNTNTTNWLCGGCRRDGINKIKTLFSNELNSIV